MNPARHEVPEALPVQYAALPWRRAGGLEILLVSSRETKRWIIPKGWPIEGLAAHEAAACEAFEEAGVRGEVSPAACGHFHYLKRQKDGTSQTCLVRVFALRVDSQEAAWPERSERTTRWFPAMTAAEAVEEAELKALIGEFTRRHRAK